MNRVDVLDQLKPLESITVRDINHTSRTRVEVTPSSVVLRPGGGGRSMEMDEEGTKSMARHAGIPTDLIQQISPRTFSQVATELLERKDKYSVLIQEGVIVGFDKPRGHRVLQVERVLQTIEKSVPIFTYQRAIVTSPATVALEVVGKVEKAVARGDLVKAGALINFSPIGTITPFIQSYVMRLDCTNGATSDDFLGKYQFGGRGGGEGDDIWQWFRHSIQEACGRLDNIVERWKTMKNERIPDKDRAMLLEGLIRDAKLTPDVAAAIRSQALERPPRNAYDMMNLLTHASSHLLEEPKQIQRVQRLAAAYDNPETHHKVCPVCRRSR